jgi:hypothetical protein
MLKCFCHLLPKVSSNWKHIHLVFVLYACTSTFVASCVFRWFNIHRIVGKDVPFKTKRGGNECMLTECFRHLNVKLNCDSLSPSSYYSLHIKYQSMLFALEILLQLLNYSLDYWIVKWVGKAVEWVREWMRKKQLKFKLFWSEYPHFCTQCILTLSRKLFGVNFWQMRINYEAHKYTLLIKTWFICMLQIKHEIQFTNVAIKQIQA